MDRAEGYVNTLRGRVPAGKTLTTRPDINLTDTLYTLILGKVTRIDPFIDLIITCLIQGDFSHQCPVSGMKFVGCPNHNGDLKRCESVVVHIGARQLILIIVVSLLQIFK